MDGGARGEAVDEEADGNEKAAGKHQGDAELGAARVVVFGFKAGVDLNGSVWVLRRSRERETYAVDNGCADLEADDEADAKGEIVQTCVAD